MSAGIQICESILDLPSQRRDLQRLPVQLHQHSFCVLAIGLPLSKQRLEEQWVQFLNFISSHASRLNGFLAVRPGCIELPLLIEQEPQLGMDAGYLPWGMNGNRAL